MTKGSRSNEELVKMYKESRNEDYLSEIIQQNTGLLNLLVASYVKSIPNAEAEDLISESYIPLLKAIEHYDESKGFNFSTLLKAYVRQHLNRIYIEATRKKRYTGSTPVSYDSLVEINKEGGTEIDGSFSIELEDISSIEFMDLIQSLDLNAKEQVAVDVLMAGGTKGEIAKALKCTPATVSYYIKRIQKKFILAGIVI